MKKILILVLFPFLPLLTNAQLHFVSEYSTDQAKNINTLTDLPLQPTHKKVDVYFNSEKPKLPYYKIRVITIFGSATDDYNHLLINLQNKAMTEGFDGLLMMDLKQMSDPYYNFITHHQELTTFQNLYAIGIKYKANMTYVDTIIKSATLQINNPLKTYHINFQMNGIFSDSIINAGHDYYLRNVSLFNKADLFMKYIYKTNTGGFYVQPDNAKLVTDSGTIRFIASLKGPNLDKVNIRLPESENKAERKYAVSYGLTHFIENPLTRWLFTGRKNQAYCKDVFNYDERNRCTGFIRYDAKTNAEILKVKYNFFSMEDLPQAEN